MKRYALAICLAGGAVPVSAGILDCDQLIDKISKRLESKHITDYALTAVPVGESHPGKEVGRCEKSSKKVMLERGKTAEKSSAE